MVYYAQNSPSMKTQLHCPFKSILSQNIIITRQIASFNSLKYLTTHLIMWRYYIKSLHKHHTKPYCCQSIQLFLSWHKDFMRLYIYIKEAHHTFFLWHKALPNSSQLMQVFCSHYYLIDVSSFNWFQDISISHHHWVI